MAYVLGGDSPTRSAFPWLTENPVTYAWGSPGEVGVDIGTPYGTPITSLTGGVVLATGYPQGVGGIVSVRVRSAGQYITWYVQHLDEIVVAPNEKVSPGTLLGYSGGQLEGGHHPAAAPYSTGPHTEVGINSPYGGIANPLHDSPNVDPVPWLSAVAQGAGGSTVQALGTAVVKASTTQDGFLPIAQALDQAETFGGVDLLNPIGSIVANIGAFFVRAITVIIGIAIILAVVSWYLRRQAGTIANGAVLASGGGLEAAPIRAALAGE